MNKTNASFTDRPALGKQELKIERLAAKIVAALGEEKLILKKAGVYFSKESQ